MTIATATNKVTWAKMARKTLRLSWWVVVFISKLALFAGIALIGILVKSNQKENASNNAISSEGFTADGNYVYDDLTSNPPSDDR